MEFLQKRLREVRLQRNETQQQVADKLHISRKLLSNYECGTREPSADMLVAFSIYYNVTVDYLVGASTVQEPYRRYPEFIVNLLNDYNYMSSESIEDLQKYIELLKIRDTVKRQQK